MSWWLSFPRSVALLIVLACGGACLGQNSQTADSGLQARIDAIRAELVTDPSKALADAEQLSQTADAGSSPIQTATVAAAANWMRAAALTAVSQPLKAVDAAERGLQGLDRYAPASPLRGEILIARGEAFDALGRVQEALADFQSAFRVFQRSHSIRNQAVALQRIASIYFEARDFTNTIKYNRQSIDAFPFDPLLTLAANNNIATAWSALKRYGDAEKQFDVALAIARNSRSQLLQARVLKNIADARTSEGKLDEAQKTLNEAYALARNGPAAKWRPALDAVQAQLLFRRNEIERARDLITACFAGDLSNIGPALRDAHYTAYQIYRATGDQARALSHLEQFKEMDDKSLALAASANAALMSARFDFANQDLKISRLRQAQAEREAVLARTRVRYRTILYSGLLAVAAIISTLLAIGFVSIRRSRNQVRAANATLQRTNADLGKALAAKTEFLATTSHEIRTPLNGILGMTQVLLADRAIEPKLKTRVELIHGAGETMRALVDDILDMAKMETGELRIHPAEMDLHRLLKDAAAVWAGQAETKGLSLSTDLADAPRGIVADEVRLRQIVFNLMSNAIKFTDRGSVCIAAHAELRGEDGEALVIRVEDSGIGIPEDRLADIFEAFQQVDGGVTRRHGGTGLGLAICRNLARAMGGDVQVRSVTGAGSTFTLDLPLARADLPASAVPHARGAIATLAEAELLLVEPNPLSQGILRALIGPRVAALHVASDVDAAHAVLEAANIDHVVADAAAFGLDPAQAARFAATAPGVRLSLLWPAPDEAVLAALTEGGWDQVLVKPLAASDLLGRLAMRYGGALAPHDLAA